MSILITMLELPQYHQDRRLIKRRILNFAHSGGHQRQYETRTISAKTDRGNQLRMLQRVPANGNYRQE
jgi:hypothetical protein